MVHALKQILKLPPTSRLIYATSYKIEYLAMLKFDCRPPQGLFMLLLVKPND